jgi:hypothetical protein
MTQVNELDAPEMFSACYHVHVTAMRRPSAKKRTITVGHGAGSGLINGWQSVRVSAELAISLRDFTGYLLISHYPILGDG